MPLVQVTMLEGRTADQKRKLAQRITDVMVEEAGARREAVVVAFHEVSKESYASGGVLMADKGKIRRPSSAVRRGVPPRDPPAWEVPSSQTE
jgi:4-oxalocrotonate tautomerase